MSNSRHQLRTTSNTATQSRAITLSPAPETTAIRGFVDTLGPARPNQLLVVLRFSHLRHFINQAVNDNLTSHLHRKRGRPPAMTGTALSKRCSDLRRRINDNVKAAIAEDWDALHKWYKPVKIHEESDATWDALLKQQEAVKERVETARKPSTDPVKKLHIVKALRNEFPKIAAQVPAPAESEPEPEPEPETPKLVEKPSFSSSPLPSYEATTGMAQSRSLNFLTARPVEDPAQSAVKRPFATPIDRRPIKRAKREAADSDDDNDGEDSDEETNGKDDGDFDPKQERGERAAARREQKQRSDDSATKAPKNDMTEEQLLRQHEELKAKFRLDQIQIFKQIAILKKDPQKHWELLEEELEIKLKRDKEKLRRKILGAE
ncbi:hypothetical protein Slin15195_G024490 [Septoria linicola]|uniref:Uncharacterized protein n=1 Tax=Septoria linicola TaxID=215465 RepID=A0A9Q9AHE5_9PEZI|nr:hypothetical protein Slin14017_G023580 [Septoria linicola]USW49130.1 hypothetical protein Slin15195_G024490 [Septoria linicola]